MSQDVRLEICVESLELAQAAARGGADRIELCGPLHDGGITPSAGLAAATRKLIDLPIAMLVRPRTGPFTVSQAEFEVMRQDVLYARTIGIDHVVLGILLDDKTVDVEHTRELVELARPMQVTFHRAFDITPDLREALAQVVDTGATRILSAGAKPSAVQGAPVVGELIAASAGRIGMLLCGGISAANVRESLQLSGAREVHAALRASILTDQVTGVILPEAAEHFTECVAMLKQRIQQESGSSPAPSEESAWTSSGISPRQV
jgi:copper homeostasis protein